MTKIKTTKRVCVSCGTELVPTTNDDNTLDGHWTCPNALCPRGWLLTASYQAESMEETKEAQIPGYWERAENQMQREEGPGILPTKEVLELHSIAVVKDPPNPHATFDLEDKATNRCGENPPTVDYEEGGIISVDLGKGESLDMEDPTKNRFESMDRVIDREDIEEGDLRYKAQQEEKGPGPEEDVE